MNVFRFRCPLAHSSIKDDIFWAGLGGALIKAGTIGTLWRHTRSAGNENCGASVFLLASPHATKHLV